MTIPHFPPMTDEQSIRFMLTLPWAMGDNAEDGSVSYDAGEIETVLRFVDSLNARAESAEATLASCNRARQAAEAECEWLRAELSVARDLLSGVPEHSAGWYADICDYLETLDNTR